MQKVMNPNVVMIRKEGVRIANGRIPREVRTALMAAVKAGDLGHMKKDGLKPQVFYHPDMKAQAQEIQQSSALRAINAIAACLA